MARMGIIGLSNVGKTTLFDALTGLSAPIAPHPYTTTEPNIGVARIPDPLLDRVAAAEGSKKTTHATLELLDLPAMAPAGHGRGPAGAFFGRLRDVEALAVVVRAFVDEAAPADEGGTDPEAQAETIGLELVLADAELLGGVAARAAKEATAEPARRPTAAALQRAVEVLDGGAPLRSVSWTAEELAAFRDHAPLTLKPAVWVVNVDEDEPDPAARAAAVAAVVPPADVVVALSARLEQEAAQLDEAEREELFEGLGLGRGARARIVQAAYEAIGLISFYTLGPKEARAWTVARGARARTAAGKIHSDMERGFIRAEVAGIADVVEAGGWDAAKAAGRTRLEGKDYEVQEGDVLLVRFSV